MNLTANIASREREIRNFIYKIKSRRYVDLQRTADSGPRNQASGPQTSMQNSTLLLYFINDRKIEDLKNYIWFL